MLASASLIYSILKVEILVVRGKENTESEKKKEKKNSGENINNINRSGRTFFPGPVIRFHLIGTSAGLQRKASCLMLENTLTNNQLR